MRDTRGIVAWMAVLAVVALLLQVVSVVMRSILLGTGAAAMLVVMLLLILIAVRRGRPQSHEVRPSATSGETFQRVDPPSVFMALRKPTVRMPTTMEADAVAEALLDSAEAAGNPVAAHLWLEDPSFGMLRFIVSAGEESPGTDPRPLDDDPLGLVMRDGSARLSSVLENANGEGKRKLWRFALPVRSGAARGVAAIDFSDGEAPDTAVLVEITSRLQGALSGVLAIHVAQAEIGTAKMLLETARELTRQLDPDEIVSHTLSRAMKVSKAATGSIMLIDPDTGRMKIAASQGLPKDIVRDTDIADGDGVAGWVLTTKKSVLIEDLPGRERPFRRTNVRSAVSVPIADEDGIIGVLNVGSRVFPARFTDSHMKALEILGTQTAVALRNAWALNSARDLYFATLRALTMAMETKDPAARHGNERVVEYTKAIGGALGLDEIEMQALEVASLLHDIGMATGDTESLSSCDRPLTTYERGLLKMHPVLAAEILQEVPALHSVIPIVYHHHESYDGRGYVSGLAGEQIPLGSRILAVADAFVAMTSERSYRAAKTVDEAMAELGTKAGTQFDPVVVNAFLDVLRRNPSPTRGAV